MGENINRTLTRQRTDQANKAGNQNARTLRNLMGMKEDPNAFGVTALSGSNSKKK
jgi:hypothetical protein